MGFQEEAAANPQPYLPHNTKYSMNPSTHRSLHTLSSLPLPIARSTSHPQNYHLSYRAQSIKYSPMIGCPTILTVCSTGWCIIKACTRIWRFIMGWATTGKSWLMQRRTNLKGNPLMESLGKYKLKTSAYTLQTNSANTLMLLMYILCTKWFTLKGMRISWADWKRNISLNHHFCHLEGVSL